MMQKNFWKLSILFSLISLILMASTSEAEIQVYDADGQYLGILLELADPLVAIFIPSLKAKYTFSHREDFMPDCGGSYYESNNCSGPSYTSTPYPYVGYNKSLDFYYMPDSKTTKTFVPKSQWYKDWVTKECECQEIAEGQWSSNNPDVFYLLQPVELPFTWPIAWPLKLEYLNGDINYDGKIGLEEAINALQVTSGVKP